MCVGAFILLVVYEAKVEVRLQLAVGDVEQVVSLAAQVRLQLLFQPKQGRGHLVYALATGTPSLPAADKLADCEVLFHDEHRLQL